MVAERRLHDPTHDEPCESTDVSPDVIGKMIPQQRIQQRIFGETVDVSVPQLQEHLIETTHDRGREARPSDTREMTHDLKINLNKIAPSQEEDTAKVETVETTEVAEIKHEGFRAHRTVEQTVATLTSQIQEKNIEVLQVMVQDCISERIIERFADVLVPQIDERGVESVKAMLQERTQEHINDEIINAPVPEMMEETIEVAQHNPQKQLQCMDKIVDVHVVTRDQFSSVKLYRRLWRFHGCSILTRSSVYLLPRNAEFPPFRQHMERWKCHRFNSLIEWLTSCRDAKTGAARDD